MIWRAASLHHFCDVLLGPVSYSRRCDVWNKACAFRVCPTGVASFGPNGTQHISRGVTFSAMCYRLGQIPTAIPLFVAGAVRNQRSQFQE